MTGTMRVPRSRGGVSGVLLVLLGLWGGLLPFAGPYLDFGFAPDDPWVYDTDRLQLSAAPGAATVLGGLIVLFSANRVLAMCGAWLAALGGAWFAVGGPVAALWDVPGVGSPLGTEEGRRVAEQLAGFTALGVVIVFLAALALGRFTVVGVRETAGGDDDDLPGESGSAPPPVYGRYARQNPPSAPPLYGAPQSGTAGDQGR
ncbi:hypothetical protein AGRA3207_007003 [Actinomadura graeca]|uniref:Secreted protein n=1 Tax=Actinomadura graeca TaxID=2750812 RepID=A0ABX8R348_9ACTN|nr:hypothetical protein [Actinomadura graeca]QXJ25501.1 hypothetical protein AGRA3207_007003 [Actinomadura graeca]